jgi:molecular chaperone GrpE
MADFDNFRKRVRKDGEEAEQKIRGRLAMRLLPVLDDYDRARGAAGPTEHTTDRDALLMILARLSDTLAREGLEPIDASAGDPFDPVRHEAIGTVPSQGIPAQHVVDVFERGYSFNGRLLRPTRVLVSSGPEGAGSEAHAKGDTGGSRESEETPDHGPDRLDPDG